MPKPSPLARLKQAAGDLKHQTYTLYFAYQDARTPWYAKIFTAVIVAYAFSPIDLIPDFIPVLGYLDDLVLIPAGIWLALKMVPAEVMADSRARAQEHMDAHPGQGRIAAVFIVLLWLVVLALIAARVYRALAG